MGDFKGQDASPVLNSSFQEMITRRGNMRIFHFPLIFTCFFCITGSFNFYLNP